MKTFKQALMDGFTHRGKNGVAIVGSMEDLHFSETGYWTFKFGDGYELCFEPLLWENQYFVALYKDRSLLTEKVVVKPGYMQNDNG